MRRESDALLRTILVCYLTPVIVRLDLQAQAPIFNRVMKRSTLTSGVLARSS
jgi:hypothetical protein